MHLIPLVRPLLTAGLLATILPTGSALATAITSGTASLNILTPVFSSGNGDADLTFTGPSAIPDQQSRLTWYYRTPADNTNHLFSFIDTPTTSFVGNTATITYANAGPGTAGVARFNAVFVFTLSSTVNGQAQVNTSLTFTASAANTGTQVFNLFNVIGFELGTPVAGTPVADTFHVTNNTGITGTVTDTGSSGYLVNFQEPGAARYEFNAGSSLNTRLTSGANNLATAVGADASDLSSTLGAAGFQYAVSLAPGASTTISTVYALNQAITVVPEPSTWALLAVAVTLGAPLALRRHRRRCA